MHTSSHEVMRWECDREQRGLWTQGSLAQTSTLNKIVKKQKSKKTNKMACVTSEEDLILSKLAHSFQQRCHSSDHPQLTQIYLWADTKFRPVTKNLAGKSPPSPFTIGHMSFFVETQRCAEETTERFFTPRLCHWDIMGPAWPKALFWFPSNGEENGSQRKVSVSVRCSLVRRQNAKNNTAGLMLRTKRGNYKLKPLDLRTFPGI